MDLQDLKQQVHRIRNAMPQHVRAKTVELCKSDNPQLVSYGMQTIGEWGGYYFRQTLDSHRARRSTEIAAMFVECENPHDSESELLESIRQRRAGAWNAYAAWLEFQGSERNAEADLARRLGNFLHSQQVAVALAQFEKEITGQSLATLIQEMNGTPEWREGQSATSRLAYMLA